MTIFWGEVVAATLGFVLGFLACLIVLDYPHTEQTPTQQNRQGVSK